MRITFSYTAFIDNVYKYVWYQTPHFAIRVNNYSTQYFTKAHYDYLLSKLPLLKPAETVFDQLILKSSLEDKQEIVEDFYIQVYSGIEVPYLLCENLPTPNPDPDLAFNLTGLLVDTLVTNPDGQEGNILYSSYRYR